MPAEEKKKVKRKPGKSTMKYKKYVVSGESLSRTGRICPKCGPAVFMGEHRDRYACGRCGFMERKVSK